MIFLHKFNESFLEISEYYAANDKKLAVRLVDEMEAAEKSIERFPKIGKPRPGYRMLALKTFPLSVCYYETASGELVGVVLYHHRQSGPEF